MAACNERVDGTKARSLTLTELLFLVTHYLVQVVVVAAVRIRFALALLLLLFLLLLALFRFLRFFNLKRTMKGKTLRSTKLGGCHKSSKVTTLGS